MSKIPLMHVDAFASAPFTGNPAAVCWLAQPRDTAWMQSLGGEMNLSETAYIEPRPGGPAAGFGLRWFTPNSEVDLCGHATLASAHALWEWGLLPRNQIARFHTRSGLLTATLRDTWIELDFPAREVLAAPPPAGLESSLGLAPGAPVFCGRGPGPVGVNYVLELASADAVRAVRPNFSALAAVDVRSVSITAPGDAGYDCVSRFFAPSVGVNEDPVTGSAHTQLATYWAARLDKPRLLAYQASPRGGVLQLELVGDRVRMSGQAVTIFDAHLAIARANQLGKLPQRRR